MAVYDRWHREPQDGAEACKCGRGRNRLYPSAAHLKGDRWQVRWRDPATGKQEKKNFALKEGDDPDRHAEAFDKVISASIVTRSYADPRAAEVTLHDYAEAWRKTRGHGDGTAGHLERRLRLHVYEAEPGSGKTPRGGVAIGQHPVGLLAQRPSLVQAWVSAVPLAKSSARVVATDLSALFDAAAADGIVARNPLRSPSVKLPPRGGAKAAPWTRGQLDAMAAQLPGRYQVVPDLGAGTGMRRGELFGLGVDDVPFLARDPRVSVVRQLRLAGGKLVFAPLKNRKPHEVPLAKSLALALSRHLELYPAAEVTLPWHDPSDPDRHGQPVTVRLVLSDFRGRALDSRRFAETWASARSRAGLGPPRRRDGKRAPRGDGLHVLRHTAASVWLAAGIDVVRVAAWLGDTPATVLAVYAHLMPGDSGEGGRAATDAFLGACAPDVPSGTRKAR